MITLVRTCYREKINRKGTGKEQEKLSKKLSSLRRFSKLQRAVSIVPEFRLAFHFSNLYTKSTIKKYMFFLTSSTNGFNSEY